MAGKAGRGADQFMLRFPEGMREKVRAAAEQSGRSMNSEIIARLEETFLEAPAHELHEDGSVTVKMSELIEFFAARSKQ